MSTNQPPAEADLPPTQNQISGGVIFNAVTQGRDITVQLPPSITPALSGMPAVSPGFTGRDEELRELLDLLAPGAQWRQPVLVTGLAGVGKTELAVQSAARARDEPGWYPGGVLVIDLFGYDSERRLTPEHALQNLLRALGVSGEHIPSDLQDRARLYRSVLAAFAEQGRRILVVLDNASTAQQVDSLLPTDGGTATLLTSRHILDVGARLHELAVLGPCASTELLRDSLRQARGPADSRVDEDPEAAAVVADLCAGLPLALRIAAALLADAPARPMASLAEALRQSHTRLDELSREDRAVRTALQLSYRGLDDEHARLFRLLPLSPGPDLSTESVSHLAGLVQRQADRLLQDLARAHLIEPGHTWGRWRLHDLVRLYADELGRARAEEDGHTSAVTRLRHHYESMAGAAETHLPGSYFAASPSFGCRRQALDWLDGERANLVAAATRGVAFTDLSTAVLNAPRRESFAYPVPAAAQHPLTPLFRYLEYRRHDDDLIAVSESAVTRSRQEGDRTSESVALDGLGVAFRVGRQFEKSIHAHSKALEIARELGTRHSEARFLCHLGHALAETHKPGQALKFYKKSAKLFARMGDHLGEGVALTSAGVALYLMRRYDEAIDAHKRALTVVGRLENQGGKFEALNNLGLALREAKRVEESIETLTEATSLAAELGYRHGEGMALSNLGNAFREAAEHKKSITAHRRAVAIAVELEDLHMEGKALGNLGIVLGDAIKFKKAIKALDRATAIFVELGDTHEESKVLNNLGSTFMEKGDLGKAIATYHRAAAACARTGDRHMERQVLRNLELTLIREATSEPGSTADLTTANLSLVRRGHAALVARIFSWRHRRR
ncbi:tetratricopeptide repeat protein [Streptomyces massasporeus]|uniref:tetratricopeptide repeat protein n=1 Tax=Streptomyces massasporeus TaxID=67324 RepID=UPI0033E26446